MLRIPLILSLILVLAAAPAHASNLLHFDFNSPWPDASADVMPSTPLDITTTCELRPVGTPDVRKPDVPSGGLLMGADVGDIGLNWTVSFMSGQLAVTNTEADLKRMKVEFDLSASGIHPVKLQIESFDAKKRRSGGLETVVELKAADSYQHFDLDLSSFKPLGTGKFSPTDPFIQLTFILGAPAWPDKTSNQLRLDNLTYATTLSDGSEDAKGKK